MISFHLNTAAISNYSFYAVTTFKVIFFLSRNTDEDVLTLYCRRTLSCLYLDPLQGGLTVPLFIITLRIQWPVTEEPYLIIIFSSGLGKTCVCDCACACVFVPVLIRIYATGPCFAVASCIAHYRYLPQGWKLKHETNREPCAAKCTQEISQARKLGCVRGVNLRLSQPEATIGYRKDAIFRKAFGLQGRKQNMVAGRYFM